jgi:hypothetical protein
VPILAPVPGDKSLLKPGAAVFLAGPKGEDGSVTANSCTSRRTASNRRCDGSPDGSRMPWDVISR